MSDNPFIDKAAIVAPEPAEFSLRPLRIQKRNDKSDMLAKSEKAEKNEKAEKPEKLQFPVQRSASSDDFVCRPMRLGSSTTPRRNVSAKSTSNKRNSKDRQSLGDLSSPKSIINVEVNTSPRATSRRGSIQVKNLPIVPSSKRPNMEGFSTVDDPIFALCLVDFHHMHGPEVQWWRSNYHSDLGPDDSSKLFKNLPFQALPDGSHLFEETFSNFNLVYDFHTRTSLDNMADIEEFKGNPNHLETLFGCSCVRQVKSEDLSEEELARNKDITRSMVQKAVVVISRKQPVFTKIKEKLAIVTQSFFEQETFGNLDLLSSLFDNLNDSFRMQREAKYASLYNKKTIEEQLETDHHEEQEEYFVNLNLRELLIQFKGDILVVLKALLLEKKVLVYSNNNLQLLTQFQNNMIALVPNLLNHLELSGCPLSDYSEHHSPLQKPTSLKTNDRLSMLRFFGLPLQVFNTKGNFWSPYLPLPQMNELKASSFMVGCSNLLIVNQVEHFGVDILVDLDASTITFPCGKPEEFRLTTLDKKFVSVILSANSKNEAYVGSDDYIRYQFEDYIRSLLATMRFQQYTDVLKAPPPGFDPVENKQLGNVKAFNLEFITKWQQTQNYHIWNATCDEFVFNFHTPVHLATEMAEPEAGRIFTGFLSSFKKGPSLPVTNSTDRATQFSHAQQPRKYITSQAAEKGKNEDDTQKEIEKRYSTGSDVSLVEKGAWGWGFKKS